MIQTFLDLINFNGQIKHLYNLPLKSMELKSA